MFNKESSIERIGKISFVIPCYNSAKTIRGIVSELEQTVAGLNCNGYEILLVNDSSPDNVFEVISELCRKNPNVRGIDLAKNFGQGSALMAGVKHTTGDVVVFLDDDGQHPPSEVEKLINTLGNDCDVAFASFEKSRHSVWRQAGTVINDYMARWLLGKPKDMQITSYYAFKRYIADELCRYSGNYPYMVGLVIRSTNKIKNIPITHKKRISGRSNYTLSKLFFLWLNGFTAFSVKPLRIATIIGSITAAVGFLYGIYVIIHRMINPAIPLGYSSTMAVLLFIGGMIMFMLGLVGEYVGRIYLNINNAPQYVIRARIGFQDENGD